MDSAVEQHLRSDVSTTVLFFQQPSIHRKHVRKRVRLHSKAITLDTHGAFASDSLVFRFLQMLRAVAETQDTP